MAKMSVGRLYTGSAADYEKPSLLKVGTGEGSQVYGWGLYASSERGVAEGYAAAPAKWSQNRSYDNGDDDRWIAYRQSLDDNRYLLVFSKDDKGGLVFHSFYKKNMNAGAESERN